MAKGVVPGGSPLTPIIGYDGNTTGELHQSAVVVEPGTDATVRVHQTRGLTVDPSATTISTGFVVPPGGWSGAPVQFNGGNSLSCKLVKVSARRGNTNVIQIGGASVDVATSTEQGLALYPGDAEDIAIGNVMALYADFLASTDGATWVVLA